MDFPIPNEIKEAIKNNRLILFVGAGLSRRFDLPSWKKMAVDIIEKIGNKDFEKLIPALDVNVLTPIEVLDKLEEEKYTIFKYIENNFSIPLDNDFSFHKELTKLSSKIITTNYDNAFEIAEPILYPVIHDSQFKLTNLSDKSNYIYKIHGCAKTDAANCLVFTSQYQGIYSNETAASLRLKEQALNNTFLFLGFSMDDPYVEKLLKHVDTLFGENKKHFMVTTNPSSIQNLKYIKPIVVNDYSQLPHLVDEWVSYKNQSVDGSDEGHIIVPQASANIANGTIRICLLKPNPLDLNLDIELPNINSQFEGLDIDIYTGILNAKNLQLVDEFDYLFLVTKSYKGKIYIEGESMKSELISLNEISDLVLNDQIPIVLIIQEEIKYDGGLKIIMVSSFRPNVTGKFVFKYLRAGKVDINEEFIKTHNLDAPAVLLTKGIATNHALNGVKKQLEFHIKKAAIVGRVEEQSVVATSMMKLAYSNKLLNIKGSGGIGKTTLIRKVSSDLYDRGYFKDGVTFNSCESVTSYQEFVDLLAKGFGLSNVDNLTEYLRENNRKSDMLVLLDNFETVSNIELADDYKRILTMLEFATDYVSIVMTSRENLDTDFEDVYTLASLNTDDALCLFTNNYGLVTDKEEVLILRSEILENLLNNNPLAIKLVTKTVVKQSGIVNLKNQLQSFFFETTSEDFTSIYNKGEDINIERSKSIYQSINYSYCKLAAREKLALEILHLFPDGISVANFKKCFAQKKSINNITDNELRILQNKSLVENMEGVLKLQPLVRRFAEFLFSKRPKEVKDKYYKDAYSFNCFVIDMIDTIQFTRNLSSAYILHNHFKDNLMLVLGYMKDIVINDKSNVPHKRYLLNYISGLHPYLIIESQFIKFNEAVDDLKAYFSDVDYADKLLETFVYRDIYFHKNFDRSYDKIQEIFPHEEIVRRDFSKEENVEKKYKNTICKIHSMEGYTLDFISSIIRNNSTEITLHDHFFYLGIHDVVVGNEIDFYVFEKSIIYGEIKQAQIEKYLVSLFKEEHLERMQTTYALSKIIKVEKSRIKPLVVTNPYTRGIKEIMYAFAETDISSKKAHFENALKYLKHIKYYYLECMYFFSEFLQTIQDDRFSDIYNEGLGLSKQYHYQYLEFKFENLIDKNSEVYTCKYEYYPIEGLAEYIPAYNKYWRKVFASWKDQ